MFINYAVLIGVENETIRRVAEMDALYKALSLPSPSAGPGVVSPSAARAKMNIRKLKKEVTAGSESKKEDHDGLVMVDKQLIGKDTLNNAASAVSLMKSGLGFPKSSSGITSPAEKPSLT